ncbi:MAG: cupin domain-containing protein [Ignavibacteria bacterium]|nr:cupin domain-containing protein [Ignavibacteria bacterium]
MNKIDLNIIEEKEIVPGYFARFVHSENMTIAYWNIKAGSSLPAHSHPHEQISSMIKGEFELTVDGTPHILKPNDVFIIPSGISHSGKAITDCKIIDTFYPVREDYIS